MRIVRILHGRHASFQCRDSRSAVHTGTAQVEAYTIRYEPSGQPLRTIAAAITNNGTRRFAFSEDDAVAEDARSASLCGTTIKIVDGRF